MPADRMIARSLGRGARHVRLLSLLEGSLLVAISTGAVLFAAVVLDHAFGLSSPARVALFAVTAATAVYFGFVHLFIALLRPISRLYVARRVESTFPHFKDSLTTYVEMAPSRRKTGAGPLVAHQAARALGGADIDAGLDAGRFVRLGYAFVVLMLAVFAYSVFSSKSMWVSLVRIANPWGATPPPTRTRISSVKPGDTSVVQGSNVEVSARISGVVPDSVLIQWSRDGELWQSVPMRPGEETWAGSIDHVETDVTYLINAGDAKSRPFKIETLVPPVVQSISARLDYPDYTGLAPRTITQGNIKAPVGTSVTLSVESNKILSDARLSIPPDRTVKLAIRGSTAEGSFEVNRSGTYAVHLADSEGLEAQAPVKYDIIATPDRAPRAALEGPPDGALVGLDEVLPFRFEASDDYGLSRMVFHFQNVEGNPCAKEFILPPGTRRAVRRSQLVPELLGARPGDTVSYYLEAFDNRGARPASSRTPSHTFKVASAGQAPLGGGPDAGEARQGDDMPGRLRTAAGSTAREITGKSASFRVSAERAGDERAQNYAKILDMLEQDKDTWEVIRRHMESRDAGATSPSPAGDETQRGNGEVESAGGMPRAASETARPGAPSGPSQAAAAEPIGPSGPSRANAGTIGEEKTPAAVSGAQRGTWEAAAVSRGAAAGQEISAETTVATAGVGAQANAAARDDDRASRAAAGPTARADAPGAEGGEISASGEGPDTGASAGTRPETHRQAPREAKAAGVAGSQAESASATAPAQPGGDSGSGSTDVEEGPSPQGASPAQDAGASSLARGTSEEGTAQGSPAGAGASESPAAGAPEEGRSEAEGSSGGGEPPTAPTPQTGPRGDEARGGGETGGRPGQEDAGAPADKPAAATGEAGSGGATQRLGEVGEIGGRKEVETPGGEVVAAPEGPRERLEAAVRMVRALVRDLEVPRIDRRLLRDLGWKPATLRTFVRRYEEALRQVDPQDFEEWVELEARFGGGGVIAGVRRAESVGGTDSDRVEDVAGEEASTAFISEDVSPEYRRLVEEYHRALAEDGRE